MGLLPTVAAVTTTSLASPAAALPDCNAINEGKVVRKRTDFNRKWVIKQIDFDENYTGSPKKMTFVLEETTKSVDNVSANFSATAKVKAGAFADLEATVGGDIGYIGEEVLFKRTTVEQTFKSGDRYFSARGGMKYSAKYIWWKCVRIQNSGFTEYTWNGNRKGTAVGYVMGKSTLGCKQATDKGTMARYIQNNLC